MQLHFFKAVVTLRLVLHVEDLNIRVSKRLTFISLSATNTLSSIRFARKTYENLPYPGNIS